MPTQITNKQIKVITDLNVNNNKIVNSRIDTEENEITINGISLDIAKQDTLNTNQMNAVNSGVTTELVEKIISNESRINSLESDSATKTYVNTELNKKQNTLTTAQLNAVNSGITTSKVSMYEDYATGKQNTLTETQLKAVNSGIDSDKVSEYNTHIENQNIHVNSTEKSLWNGKQNALTTAQLNAVNSGINATKVQKYDEYETEINSKVNSSEIKTVARTGNYNDLTNKPTIPTVNNSKITIKQGDTIKGEFNLNQNNDSTISLELGEVGGNVDDVKVNGTSVVLNKTAIINVPTNNNQLTNGAGYVVQSDIDTTIENSIINDVQHTDTNKSLSANMGKELQEQINNLKARGRFLSLWNCNTGLATTVPTINPYDYKTGDYFIISYVSTTTTNYRPSGSFYDKDIPSTTIETDSVAEGDTYYYDGNSWALQKNTGIEVSFANIGGDAYDNSNLATALNEKENIENKTNDYTETDIDKYPSSFALNKGLASVKPIEVTLSAPENPSTQNLDLGDTCLNTTQKKLYTTIANNYRLNTNVDILGNLDLDYSSGVAGEFKTASPSSNASYIKKNNIDTALLWQNNVEYKIHFKLKSIPLTYAGLFLVASSSSSTYETKNINITINSSSKLQLTLQRSQMGPSYIYKSYVFDNYTIETNKEYFLIISKTGNTAEIKLYSGNYGDTELLNEIIETEDYIVSNATTKYMQYGYAYYSSTPYAFYNGQIYLADSTGNFLVADGNLAWNSGENLINSTQYVDTTNGIIYLYSNNQLFSNAVEFSKIQGSPYDNSALSDVLDSKADIGDIKNSTITINQGGVFKGEFTLNQSDNATINLDAGGEGGSYPIYERVITEEDFQNYKVSYKGNEDDEYLDIISLINDEQINGNINLNNYRCFMDGANLSNRFIIFKNGEILFDSMEEGGCGKALELNNAFIIFEDTSISAPQLEDSSTAAIELNTNSNLTFKNLNIEAMFSNDKAFVKFNDENSRLELENITSNIICNEDLSGEDANFEFGFIYVDENNNSVSFKNCNRIRIANDQADDDAEIQCYFIRTAQNKTIRIEGYNSTIVMHGRGNGQVFDVNLDNENIEVSNNDFQGSLTARFETSEETLGDKLQNFPTTIEMGEYWDIGEWEGENYAMRVRVNETFTANNFDEYLDALRSGKIDNISKSIYSFNNNSYRNINGYGYLFTSNSNPISTKEIMFEDGGFRVSGLMEARDGQALVFNGGEFRPQDINGGGNDDGYMHPRNNDEFMEIINNRNNAAISFDQFDYSTIPSQGYQISDKDYFEFKDLDLSTGRDDFDFDILNHRLFYFENSGIKFKNLNINIDGKEVSGYNPVIEFGGNDNYKELHIEDSNININNVLYQDNNYSFRVIYVDSKRFSMKNSSVYVRAQDDSTKGQFLVMHTSDYLYFDAGLISLNIENSNINVNNFNDFTAAIVYEGPGVKNADSSLRLNVDKSSINAWCNDFNNSVNIKLINNANDININYSQVGKLDVVKLNDWDFQDWKEGNTYNQNDKIKWTAPWDENFKKYLLVKNGFTTGDPDSIWQEYDNGNIEDYYQVNINGTLYSASDPENLIHFNGNGTNIYTDGVNTRNLTVNEENWRLPIYDEKFEADNAYDAIKELAEKCGEPKVINVQGDEAYINVVGNIDYEIEDELSKLTINSNGGLKEIYRNNVMTYMSYNDGKYWLSDFYYNKGIKYSTDLNNWTEVFIREYAYAHLIIFGKNIIVVTCNGGYACIDKNDFSKVKFIEISNQFEHFDSVACKDGYIYVHSPDRNSVVSYDRKVLRFRDDFEEFSYEEKDSLISKGFSFINNNFYIVNENILYKSNDIWNNNSWTSIYERQQASIEFAPVEKDNTLYLYISTWYYGYKWITTTDDFNTTIETDANGGFSSGGNHFEIVQDDYIYCIGSGEKLYQINLTNFEVNVLIDDYGGNFISDLQKEGILFVKQNNYAASYSAPQPYPRTETNIYFRTGEEIEFNYPNDLKWTNEVITELEPYTEYEMNIRRGIVTLSKVVSQQ